MKKSRSHAKARRREGWLVPSMVGRGVVYVGVLGVVSYWVANRMVNAPESAGYERRSQVAASSAKAKQPGAGFSLGLERSRAVPRTKTLVGKEILPFRSPRDPEGPVLDLRRLLGPGTPGTAGGADLYLKLELFTRRYDAPLFFMNEEAVEPFLNEGVASKRKKSAKQILMEKGVEFDEEGSTAFYIRSASELVVRATADQLDKVDRLVEEWLGGLTSDSPVEP